jgi:hypothetical protein
LGVKDASVSGKGGVFMKTRFAVGGIALALCGMAPAASAAPPEDACAFVTSAQVGTAAGAAFDAGTYVTPTFKKTCTWKASKPVSGGSNTITLLIMTQAGFDGGKKFGAAGKLTPAGLGDDSYFLETGPQVGLAVKKGGVFLKVEVYGGGPDKEKAIEKAVAQQVLAKL